MAQQVSASPNVVRARTIPTTCLGCGQLDVPSRCHCQATGQDERHKRSRLPQETNCHVAGTNRCTGPRLLINRAEPLQHCQARMRPAASGRRQRRALG